MRAAVLSRLIFIAIAAISSELTAAQVELPQPDSRYPISVEAEHGNHWTEGAYDVWVLSGNCRLTQGPSHASANEAVLWIDHSAAVGEPGYKMITYLDGKVQMDFVVSPSSETDPKIQSDVAKGTISRSPAGLVAKLQDKAWFGRLYSNSAPEIHAAKSDPEPGNKPAVYVKAMSRRTDEPYAVVQAQFQAPAGPPAVVSSDPVLAGGGRRIRFSSRSSVPIYAESTPNPATNETITVVTGGINVLIDGLPNYGGRVSFSGAIDISADRLVVWSGGTQAPDFNGQIPQSNNTSLELYMEGNIVLQEGDRVVQAKAMYYNVNLRSGVILDAELLTAVPRFQGLVRLKADVIRQIDRDRYVADNASLTTSRMGIPTYEFKSGTLVFEDQQAPVLNPFTGQPEIDPQTKRTAG